MAKKQLITKQDIAHLSQLARLPLTGEREKVLTEQVGTVFEYAENLKKVVTDNIPETNQVTGLTNVWRDDVVDTDRMFSQEDALKNAKQTHKGYFLVPAILE